MILHGKSKVGMEKGFTSDQIDQRSQSDLSQTTVVSGLNLDRRSPRLLMVIRGQVTSLWPPEIETESKVILHNSWLQ